MKRIYTIIDNHTGSGEPVKRTLEFPVPFEQNLEAEFRLNSFLESINHETRTIVICSGYDSGKKEVTITPRQERTKKLTTLQILENWIKTPAKTLTFQKRKSNILIAKRTDKLFHLCKDTSFTNGKYNGGFNMGAYTLSQAVVEIDKRGYNSVVDAEQESINKSAFENEYLNNLKRNEQLKTIAVGMTLEDFENAVMNNKFDKMTAIKVLHYICPDWNLRQKGEFVCDLFMKNTN